jgi:enoyl-CoA hydratase/carnithine racemase
MAGEDAGAGVGTGAGTGVGGIAPALLHDERDGLMTLTVNRPEKFNPLSREVLAALRAHLEGVATRPEIRCVAIRGAGNRYFAAGGDLRDLAEVRSPEQTHAMVATCRGALDAVRTCPVPVVAVLNGDAIGGGAELAVACDFRLMRAGAHLGFIHGKLAITAAWGGSADLYTLVGRSRALRMTTRAEPIPAALALDWGLADAVHPEAELDAGVAAFVAPLLRQTPALLRAFKAQAIAARRGASYDERRALEEAQLVQTWTHADHWAAVERVLPSRKERT